MRRRQGDRAALGRKGRSESIGHALAVIVVGIGDRHRFHAAIRQDIGHDLALTGIRRGGAEEQAIIFGRRQRRRGGGGRNHPDAVRARHVLQHGAGHARAIAADDACNLVRGGQTFGSRLCGSGIDAGGIAAHRGHGGATHELARFRGLFHRQFGAGSHAGNGGFKRAGEAQQNAQFNVFGGGHTGHQGAGCGGKQQFLHYVSPMSKACRIVIPSAG